MDVEDEVTRLQGRLAEAVAHVRSLPEDDDRYGDAADEAIDLARRLVDLEERMPALQDVGPHRTTVVLVRGTVVLLLATAVGFVVAALVGRLGFGWIVLAFLLVVVAGALFLPPVPPTPPGAHQRHRLPAVADFAGGLCLVLAAVGVNGWLVPAGLLLLVIGLVSTLRLREG